MLNQRPFIEIGMRNIAAEAGVSAASIYRYFPGRNDLLIEALTHQISKIIEEFDQYTIDNPINIEGLSEYVVDYLMDNRIIWVGPSAGSEHWIDPPRKYLFGVYPLYYLEAKALCRHAVDTMGKKKIAIIYQNDDYGKSGVRGAKDELGPRGLDLVAEVPVNVTDSDLKPHVMRLKSAGADVVLVWTNPKHAVMTVGISQAMQFAPQFMSTSTCSDFPLMMHISKGAWQGAIAATFAELPDEGNALLEKYKQDAFDKFAAKDERWGLFYYAGIAFAEPLVEAIRRAGPDLTRETVVAQLEAMQEFKGISGKISYAPFDPTSPACRQGQKQVFLVECLADGKAKRLTPWMTIE
jgi:ABC-type branched-subunit amino acid transport system substrate-binding protein